MVLSLRIAMHISFFPPNLQLFDCLIVVHPHEGLFVGILPICRKFQRPGS